VDTLSPPAFQKREIPTPPPFPGTRNIRQKRIVKIPWKFVGPVGVLAMTAALVGLMLSAIPSYDILLEGPQVIEWGRINGGNFVYEIESVPQAANGPGEFGVYFLKSDEMNYYQLAAATTGEMVLRVVERGTRRSLPLSNLPPSLNFDQGLRLRIVRSLGDDIQIYVGDNIVFYSENSSWTSGTFGIEQQGPVIAGYRVSLRQQM
jgi:hypothetical protein